MTHDEYVNSNLEPKCVLQYVLTKMYDGTYCETVRGFKIRKCKNNKLSCTVFCDRNDIGVLIDKICYGLQKRHRSEIMRYTNFTFSEDYTKIPKYFSKLKLLSA